jgi:TatA/E family protein of Tat protein translocase
MEIFGIGPGEMLIILALALVIVGPQKLPEIGRNLGRTLGEFKAQTDAMRSVLTFDPLAAPTAAPAAPAAPAGKLQATIHSDARVTAMQAYGQSTEAAPAAPSEPTTLTFAPDSQEPAA